MKSNIYDFIIVTATYCEPKLYSFGQSLILEFQNIP